MLYYNIRKPLFKTSLGPLSDLPCNSRAKPLDLWGVGVGQSQDVPVLEGAPPPESRSRGLVPPMAPSRDDMLEAVGDTVSLRRHRVYPATLMGRLLRGCSCSRPGDPSDLLFASLGGDLCLWLAAVWATRLIAAVFQEGGYWNITVFSYT